jgi:predicted regulator of Ras-like GTPase activity (Roadblock/LC7/MglB family)
MTKAQTALAELTEISTQVEDAVIVDSKGAVAASTLPDDRAARLASGARQLLETAAQAGEAGVTQLEAATADGSLFVVREGGRLLAATTGPDPTAGLVFYDLRRCLRQAGTQTKRKRAPKSGSS